VELVMAAACCHERRWWAPSHLVARLRGRPDGMSNDMTQPKHRSGLGDESDIGAPILVDAVMSFIADEALSRGAAIAFYEVTSLAPVLLIVIAIAGLAFGRDAAQNVSADSSAKAVAPIRTVDSTKVCAIHCSYR